MAGRISKLPLAERLELQIDRLPDAPGCWLWTGKTDRKGYGLVMLHGRSLRAHRVMYEQRRGPIPPGLTLDHLCRVRSCVSPAHLEAVTNRVNVLRSAGPSAENAQKTHCKRGHPLPATRNGGRRCSPCAVARASEWNRRHYVPRGGDPKSEDHRQKIKAALTRYWAARKAASP
jgi:hypothetical protein